MKANSPATYMAAGIDAAFRELRGTAPAESRPHGPAGDADRWEKRASGKHSGRSTTHVREAAQAICGAGRLSADQGLVLLVLLYRQPGQGGAGFCRVVRRREQAGRWAMEVSQGEVQPGPAEAPRRLAGELEHRIPGGRRSPAWRRAQRFHADPRPLRSPDQQRDSGGCACGGADHRGAAHRAHGQARAAARAEAFGREHRPGRTSRADHLPRRARWCSFSLSNSS